MMVEELSEEVRERAWVSQLKKATLSPEPYVLESKSKVAQWCVERQIKPKVIPMADVDDFLKGWRGQDRGDSTKQMIVVPISERKLYWNVLRDLMVSLPRVLDSAQVKPTLGACVLVGIGSDRQARRFRVAVAAQASTITATLNLVEQMTELTAKAELRSKAEKLLEELCAFGAMDALPASRLRENDDNDPEDDNADVYVPYPSKTPKVNLDQRIKAVKLGELAKEQVEAVKLLLEKFKIVFRDPAPGTVPRTIVEHKILFSQDRYVSTRAYRLSPTQTQALQEHIQDLLRQKMVTPSSSPYSSAVFPIPKKDANGKITETRWVFDFRAINAITIPDRYPLPIIEDLLNKVTGAELFSKVDLKSGYWQLLMRRQDQEKTAFITPFGLYQWVTMPFGLSNAPATFQRLIDRVLEGCSFAVGYIDDILIFSRTFDDHMKHLQELFSRLKKYGLCVSAAKCTLAVPKVLFLGYVLARNRLHADPVKVETIWKYPPPKTLKAVQRFLGMVGYYRKFIRGFSVIASPLSELTKKRVQFTWGPAQQHAFETLRNYLTRAPIMVLPNWTEPFILETDASVKGIGGVLSQDFPDGRLAIAFVSRKLTPAEARYSTRELEALAILFCLKRFATYVQGRKFSVLTDHASLEWIWSWKDPSPRVQRWLSQLSAFGRFPSRYRPGKENKVADALSRVDAITVAPVKVSQALEPKDLLDFPAAASWKEAYAEDSSYGPFLQFRDDPAKCTATERLRFERWAAKFHWVDGMLYLRRPGSVDARGVLVIPELFRTLFLMAYHDLPTAGHMGRDKMYGIMSKRFYWPTLTTDISTYIKGCLSCALMRTQKPPRTAMALFDDVVTRPFDIIHVDHITHMPLTPRGYDSILVIADRCTGWVEAKPVKSLSAAETAEGIMEMVVHRHGVPGAIVTDNGGAFIAQLLTELAERCGFKQRFTTAYNPMSNGFVERRNGMIKKMLRAFCAAEQTSWDLYLGAILFAIRTAPMDKTKMTPAFLVYGRELITPVEALLSSQSEAPVRDPTQYVISRIRVMKKAREMVASLLHRLREERVTQEQALFGEVSIVPGDYVLLHHPTASHEKLSKLLPYFSGPHLVVRKTGETTLEIEEDGKLNVVNVRRVVKCNAELVRRHVHRRPGRPLAIQPPKPPKPTKPVTRSDASIASTPTSAPRAVHAPLLQTGAEAAPLPQSSERGAPEAKSDTEAAPLPQSRERGVSEIPHSRSAFAPTVRERTPQGGLVTSKEKQPRQDNADNPELALTEPSTPTVVVRMDNEGKSDKRRKIEEGPTWQQRPKIEASKIKIGTFVIVSNGKDLMLGKVTGSRNSTWIAHRWRSRNTRASGLKKRFFPAWQKDGKISITAHPPRFSSPVQFPFTLDYVLCSGFRLISSMPEQAALDFIENASLTVSVITGPNGIGVRRTWTNNGAGAPCSF